MDQPVHNGVDEKETDDDPRAHMSDSPDSMSDAGNVLDLDQSSTRHAANGASHEDGTTDTVHTHPAIVHVCDDFETEETEDASEQHEDSEYDEEEDEEDEEDEDEDEEPALKYERMGGIVHNLLQKDSASALAYSNQRFVRSQTHV